MKQVFQFTAGTDSSGIQPVLNIRVGQKHFSCVWTDNASGQLNKLSYWTADAMNADTVSVLLDADDFAGSFYQVNICYDYPDNILVPSAGFRHEDASLLKYGIPGAGAATLTITELLTEWQLYNVYAVPEQLHELLSKRFPGARFWHQSTVDLKNIRASGGEGCLQVDFRHFDFSLIAVRSAKLLLARSFEYSTPEDVLYYLLNTCRQFSLSQNDVRLELSGLVDRQSALYRDLYQYFSNIHFRESSWRMNETEYPGHFFTSLNDLSVCVS